MALLRGIKLFCLCFVACGFLVNAQDALPSSYKDCGSYRVKDVLTGDHFLLEDDTILQLDMVMMPKVPYRDIKHTPWPMAESIKRIIAKKVKDQTITLKCAGDSQESKNGYRLASVTLADGTWLQEEILREGLGWANVYGNDMALAADMMALEDVAREQSLGLWSFDAYKIRDAKDVDRIETNRFHVIRGTVANVYQAKKQLYLNFDENYFEDFTIESPNTVTRQAERGGIEYGGLEGKTIEVRGWVDFRGGPRIVITEPTQMRVVE